MPNVKPCHTSGFGTVHENVEKVPRNWIVPWPSVPCSTSSGSCTSADAPPPKYPAAWLTIVNDASKSYVMVCPLAPKLTMAMMGSLIGSDNVTVYVSSLPPDSRRMSGSGGGFSTSLLMYGADGTQ